MRSLTVVTIILAPLLAAGCMARVGYTATVSNEGYGPDLVYAAPGVQVIADFDEPIFYVDNFYWRFYGGGWYRSPHHTGGWVFASPPPAVRRIDRPQAFVHYRPAGWVGRRERGAQQPSARDHRDDRPRVEPGRGGPPPGPPMHQQPQPRAAQPQWQQQQQQQRRPAQPQAPAQPARPESRDRDHRGDHGDRRGDGDHRDHR